MARKRAPRGSSASLKAGVFLTFCLGLFVGMFFVYGHLGSWWRGTQEIRVLFRNVRTLKIGAPVLYNGMEIGHVKTLQIVHASPALMKELPPIQRRDLEDFPLTDDEVKDYARLEPAELDQKAKTTAIDRTMVLLTLQVLLEKDDRRFKIDDEYVIVGSMMGDSAVEIVTGNGKAVNGTTQLFLGNHADMLSDLGNNMAQVKDIMQSMSDIVSDATDKGLIQGQLANFDRMTEQVERQTEEIATRLPLIFKNTDERIDATAENLNEIEKKLVATRPKVDDALAKTQSTIADMRKALEISTDETQKQLVQYHADAIKKVKDWQKVSAEYKESLPPQLHSMRKWSDDIGPTVLRADSMLERLDDQLDKEIINTRASIGGYSRSASAFEETTFRLKRWPTMAGKIEPEVEKARVLIWHHDLMKRQYLELRGELDLIRKSFNLNDASERARAQNFEQLVRASDDFFRLSPEQRRGSR